MNRRIRRARASSPAFSIRDDWHTRQQRLRHAFRLGHRGSTKPVDATPIDPLHTQWLSGTLTPWEYQHLVRRSTEHRERGDRDHHAGYSPDDDWWIRVASEIEDDFLYRFSAPCGAD